MPQRGAGAEVSVGVAILREGPELGSWPSSGRLHPGWAPTLSFWAGAWTWDLEFQEAAGAPAQAAAVWHRGDLTVWLTVPSPSASAFQTGCTLKAHRSY